MPVAGESAAAVPGAAVMTAERPHASGQGSRQPREPGSGAEWHGQATTLVRRWPEVTRVSTKLRACDAAHWGRGKSLFLDIGMTEITFRVSQKIRQKN